MLREEMLVHLNALKHITDDSSMMWLALDMAIKAIEQEPCEDVISRQAAIDALTKTSGIRGDALKALYDLQSVNPQPKTGHWNRVTDKAGHLVWECDCGWQQRFATNFCPDCGTKMAESEDNE